MTMDSSHTKSPTAAAGRGRPRDPEADERILSAARTLLAQNGFEAMSFEAIARATGVTRPTIYRRWPTKAHLANEIANGSGRGILDVVETEGLRAQILAFLEQLLQQYQRPEMSAANAGLIVSYHQNPELRDELHTPLESKARADLARIMRRATSRGLVRPEVEPDALFDIAVGAVVFRTMFSSLPPTETLIEDICDIVLDGIEVDCSRRTRSRAV